MEWDEMARDEMGSTHSVGGGTFTSVRLRHMSGNLGTKEMQMDVLVLDRSR